jgi:cytochrome oxidase assembly protein ShyY1
VGIVIWPLLRTRRWLGFTALVIVAIVAFGLLSRWQWSRADQKRLERTELQTALALPAGPVSAVVPASDGTLPPADEWRHVQVSGTYLTDRQALVRKRPLDAQNGFWVMSPLRSDGGATVWVNRGWLPAGQDALATPPIPAPPAGTVTVTGYLRAFEPAAADANTGLPTGQIAAPAVGLLPDLGDAAVGIPAYVQLAESDPAQDGLVVLPLPEIDEGRNVSYAVQWILFAAVAIGGWFFFLRREALEDAARDAGPPAPVGSGGV